MLRKMIFTALLILTVAMPLRPAAASDGDHNLWRMLKSVAPEKIDVFEATILPWIQKEFSNKIFMDTVSTLKRGLVRSDLLRYEIVDGQDRYNVHLEYTVSIRDASGFEVQGLKGQEIVFWVNDGAVEDYFPFEEYWIYGGMVQDAQYY